MAIPIIHRGLSSGPSQKAPWSQLSNGTHNNQHYKPRLAIESQVSKQEASVSYIELLTGCRGNAHQGITMSFSPEYLKSRVYISKYFWSTSVHFVSIESPAA